jgi:hypothetical protein
LKRERATVAWPASTRPYEDPRRIAASWNIRSPVGLISISLLTSKTAGTRRREGWIKEVLMAVEGSAHDLRYRRRHAGDVIAEIAIWVPPRARPSSAGWCPATGLARSDQGDGCAVLLGLLILTAMLVLVVCSSIHSTTPSERSLPSVRPALSARWNSPMRQGGNDPEWRSRPRAFWVLASISTLRATSSPTTT